MAPWHEGAGFMTYGPSDHNASEPPIHEAVVEIPEYSSKRPGNVHVHFYKDHQVKVVVARYGIEHPRYPMSAQDKLPWETSQQLIEYEKQRTLPE